MTDALIVDRDEARAALETVRFHLGALRTEMSMMRDLLGRKQNEIARLRGRDDWSFSEVRYVVVADPMPANVGIAGASYQEVPSCR